MTIMKINTTKEVKKKIINLHISYWNNLIYYKVPFREKHEKLLKKIEN